MFAPAWTLDFWQAWLFSFVFAAAAVAITAYLWKQDPQLLERRLRAGPTAEKEPTQQLVQLGASLAFAGMLVAASLDRRFAWSHVPLAGVIGGEALVVLGFAAVFVVLRENTFAASTIELAPDQRVISTGPYALVRHPMYAGALVMLAGAPLALGSWWALLTLVPLTLVLVVRLLAEETFLAKHLPGYVEYCTRVKYRLLPGLW